MKHLVFGAGGQVGSSLAERLALMGEEVFAFYRPGREVEDLRALGVRAVHGDLLDEESVRRAVAGMDNVYNCAAVAEGTAARMQAVNVLAVNSIILACRGKQVNRIVHLSCASVHGDATGEPIDETAPVRPESPHARSKAEAERVVHAYFGQPDLRITVLRLPVPVGPDDARTTLPLVAELRARPRASFAAAPGRAVSFVDAIDAARAALAAAADDRAIGRTYLVRSFDATPGEFAEALGRAIGIASPRGGVGRGAGILSRLWVRAGRTRRIADVWEELARSLLVSDGRIRSELGFSPEHTLESTAARIAGAYWDREIARLGRPPE